MKSQPRCCDLALGLACGVASAQTKWICRLPIRLQFPHRNIVEFARRRQGHGGKLKIRSMQTLALQSARDQACGAGARPAGEMLWSTTRTKRLFGIDGVPFLERVTAMR